MKATGWLKGLEVTAGGTGVVSHAGLVLLRALADKTGLTAGLSKALACDRLLVHDRGRVLRTVSIPATILPDIAVHLAMHTRSDANALVFTGIKGGPLRRSGFNKLSGWPHVVTGMGLPGLHIHDLRHTGNTLAADMGVSLRNLMARMGHDNERAALIYQHKSSPADRQIADGLDALLRASRDQRTDDDGTTGALAPVS